MSCLGKDYNPMPTREWYRFQNRCAYDTTPINETIVYVPLLKDYVPSRQLAYELAVLKKGNILQYKKNSSNLTKNQRYSQIAQGAWTNRTTTWATQTDSYTNPNIKSLKRVNYTILPINPISGQNTNTVVSSTADGLFCPTETVALNGFVPTNNSSGSNENPTMPPINPAPPSINPIIPSIVATPTVAEIVIPDGGNLLCNVIANSCTGEVYKITSGKQCNPLSASDVPGPTTEAFCYNSSLPTYYPRTRNTYASAGSKWPTGAKLIFPA